MDRLTQRLDVARRALSTMEELPLDGVPTKRPASRAEDPSHPER